MNNFWKKKKNLDIGIFRSFDGQSTREYDLKWTTVPTKIGTEIFFSFLFLFILKSKTFFFFFFFLKLKNFFFFFFFLKLAYLFPFVLAFGQNSIEIRTLINGKLIQTLPLHSIKFLVSQEYVYITSEGNTDEKVELNINRITFGDSWLY